MLQKTYIIAEAGVNHNGDILIAKELIRKAKEAGADCVKFQTFKAEQIVTKTSPKAKYQLEVTDKEESQFEMLKKLEMDFSGYLELVSYCGELDIDFMSTPYNKEDVDFLEELGVNAYKIASGQLTEIPFLKYVARKNKQIFLSTGMGTLADVYDAVEAIKGEGNTNLTVLQCTTNYPSRIEDANILAMNSMKEACDVKVGYSDHVTNNYACFAAVALGASVIEKHLTIDKLMEGPDHSCSLTPAEFKDLVEGIRNIELSLGSKVKKPSPIEIENSKGMKRGLVVLQDLEEGTVLKEEFIGFKRPLNGIPISMLDQILGKKISKEMKSDEVLDFDCIIW
ncbi:N-acetylneuraminate synthase/N,N'-diacetyllegionaminate synthase [Algoriphagus iocasae]|jgi:N,N'-diacetyllegionaminate synthase|uniref:N-acetylneuraminate synthase/N,N'-diacetyllegionaminate synthase n=1 Tax=Algoriphagus iocasae TaxID=1836499 RepID=A0A841MSV0_9BACT|nr:N-acetylneuraminate synthase [Algoriphagus iocasae]MBB6327734.1 N-acetylneuraminate synthase/N,N'-diacetyllegionaminate synthase [Algoriphagus iocasae]